MKSLRFSTDKYVSEWELQITNTDSSETLNDLAINMTFNILHDFEDVRLIFLTFNTIKLFLPSFANRRSHLGIRLLWAKLHYLRVPRNPPA